MIIFLFSIYSLYLDRENLQPSEGPNDITQMKLNCLRRYLAFIIEQRLGAVEQTLREFELLAISSYKEGIFNRDEICERKKLMVRKKHIFHPRKGIFTLFFFYYFIASCVTKVRGINIKSGT